MTGNDKSTQGEEMIGQLIAKAGRGPTASPEARERVYAAVRARWEDRIAAGQGSADGTDGPAADNKVTVLRPRAGAAKRRSGASHPRWHFRALGLAASVLAVALVFGWLQQGTNLGLADGLARLAQAEGSIEIVRDGAVVALNADQQVAAGDLLRTASNGRAELKMNDGLMLRLNANTEIRLANADAVELAAGAVYVDTGNGISSQALEISTPLGGIRHLGTQYEVNYDGAGLRLRVREGRVAYRSDAAEAVGVAGEQLDIDESGVTARSAIAPDDPAWEWASALASLPQADEYRLDETLTWIARERGLTLDYANAASRQRISTQLVYGLEGLDPIETLDVILRTTDITAEIRDTSLVVSN